MAIGDVKASGGLQSQLVSDQSSEITARAASGLGDAINSLMKTGLQYLGSRTDIERIYDQRAMGAEAIDINNRFLQYQTDRGKEFAEFSRNRSANPLGMTKQYEEELRKREDEFLATVPERHRKEYQGRLEEDRARRVGSAFTSELSLLDEADTNNLNNGLNTLGSALKGKQTTLEDAQAEWADIVGKSSLPEETKQQFIENGNATLQGLEFGTIVEEGAKGLGAVNDGSTGDVSAAGLMPAERGVLNVISSGESPGYNVWNGGSTFEGYEDHPAASGSAPGKSTAAGKYQFILGTWRAASASYEATYGIKVPNFSPEWQDRVALHWAEKRFNELNGEGLTFKGVLASGDPQQMLKIRDVLGKPRGGDPNAVEWEGLGHVADAEFLEILTGQKGMAGGGTGPATMPDVWTDPRFAGLDLDAKLKLAGQAQQSADTFKTEQANALRLERDKYLDSAYEAGFNGTPVDNLKSSPYWGADAQAKFNAGMEVKQKSEAEGTTVASQLAAGVPLAASQSKAFGRWFGQEAFTGIMDGSAAAYDKMRWAVTQARMFPEGSVDAFRAAMANPNTASGAVSFLASAYAGDSSILKRSGFSNEDISAVNLFKRIAERSGSEEQAYADWTKAMDAESRMGKSEAQLGTEATKLFTETYTSADDLVDMFDGWLTFSPNTTLNENTEGQLMLDANTAFQDGYKIYGTQEGAEAYMQAALNNMWGVSQTKTFRDGNAQFGEGVLMKYPPEKYYVAHDNDFGYLYKSISDYAVAGGASPSNAVLLADDITAEDVRKGKPPTYKVIGQGEYGEAIILPGRFGGEAVQAGQVKMIEEESMRKNSLQGIETYGLKSQDLQRKRIGAAATGASQEDLDLIDSEIAKAEQGVAAARRAALENGHISGDAPTSVDDPKFESFSKGVVDTFTQDPVMPQRIKKLAASYKGLSMPEANMKAMTELFMKDYGVTSDIAVALVQKVME